LPTTLNDSARLIPCRRTTDMTFQQQIPGLLAASLILVIGPTAAMGQHMNATDAPCHRTGADTEQTQCFVSAVERTDQRLNEVYRQIMAKLSDSERVSLRAAERLWIQYRDATCKAESDLFDGATTGPTAFAACIEFETRVRTTDLMAIYGWRLEK
jgi:uncharacterized protein YecT (DUF1311 family)